MFNRRFKFLGLNFHNFTLDEAIEQLEYFIQTKKPHMVFTTGAELIIRAQNDKFIKSVYDNTDLLTMDSVVVYYAAKLAGLNIKEPVSAAQLTLRFLEKNAEKGYRFYILGAKDKFLKDAVSNLKKMYPNINTVGWHHGYFDIENDGDIVDEIKSTKPDILLVAMSSPLKERFISKNYKKIGVPVSIGVGGTIDIIARKYKLAPKWISILGLEWFYRFIQEPVRLWKRYLITNSIFIYLVIKELLGRHNK